MSTTDHTSDPMGRDAVSPLMSDLRTAEARATAAEVASRGYRERAEKAEVRHETPDVAELRRLAENATPGPWDYYRPNPNYQAYEVDRVMSGGYLGETVAVTGDVYAEKNAAFITAANPAAVLGLLDEADALAERAEKAEALIEDMVPKTWDGLLALLDEVYPDDVFPTLPDDPARDAGPRAVSLIRYARRVEAERDALRAERDALAAQVERVRALHSPIKWAPTEAICDTCSVLAIPDVVEYPCDTLRALDGDGGTCAAVDAEETT